MISDEDFNHIAPKSLTAAPSHEHVESGAPIPKSARIRTFSPDDWEAFVEEWATSLDSSYQKVRRFGGSGDLGVDIAGFSTDEGFFGAWDNYQCKRYDHSLRPSDVWVEIGKIIYYSHIGEYQSPQRHYFVCSQGIGTSLEYLLNKPDQLKCKAQENWDKHCRHAITQNADLLLTEELEAFFNHFDFGIFASKSLVELIDGHAATGFHAVRFGGGLPPRPHPDAPPDTPATIESRYVRQLLDAYGDHLGTELSTADDLGQHNSFRNDFLRQRERFYHAESLRNFARDTVPKGTFDGLQEEILYGVVDVCEGSHADGFERMRKTVSQAATVAIASNPLASTTKVQDKQGMCHQLANEDRLEWVPSDE